MDRMKTFFNYLLAIVGFFILSLILEGSLLENMYDPLVGSVTETTKDIVISDVSGKACNVNGKMQLKVKNNSSNPVKNRWVKVDLYSKRDLLGLSKYIELKDIGPGEEKLYKISFKGEDLRKYELSVVDHLEDRTNIISIMGWDIDLTDVFGMDLSNFTIFGTKLTDIFTWDGVVNTGKGLWGLWISITSSIPWWGYAIASGIILWYMPKGYLFGIFPF